MRERRTVCEADAGTAGHDPPASDRADIDRLVRSAAVACGTSGAFAVIEESSGLRSFVAGDRLSWVSDLDAPELAQGVGLIDPLASDAELVRCDRIAGAQDCFVAGILVRGAAGRPVGVLCVHDGQPRRLSPDHVTLLRALAEAIAARLAPAPAAPHPIEIAFKAREAELRLIANAMPVLVAFVDREGIYRFMNAASVDWFGRSPEAMLGLSMRDVVGEAAYALRRPAIEKALGGQEARLELDWPWMDGRPRTAEIRFIPRVGIDGTIDGFYGFIQDVSDRKRTETLFAARTQELETQVAERTRDRDRIWTLSPVLKVVANPAGVVQAVNPSWSRALGFSEAEAVGRSVLDFIVPEERALVGDKLARRARSASVRDFETSMTAKSGRVLRISWSLIPENGILYGFGLDVTEQRQAEEALRQSQKLEAVGQLTGGIAHDFNNLLTIIRSSVDFLRRRDLPEDRHRRYVDAVSETVDRAAKLTGQLLAFARRQALKPEVFEVGVCLRAVADMLDTVTGARIRVMTELPATRCYVRADLSQFETALVNMAVNARDAMNGEGRLTLRLAGNQTMPAIRGHAGGGGSFAAISLSDTGTGIAPDILSHIFEPFFTTKEVGKGTGLGLSQVFGFAKQSGGDVDVTSTVGVGTTFTLYLPEAEAPQAEIVEPREAAVRAPSGAGRRVLVVEDNVEVGRFATQTLEDLGYVTTWAANAVEALTHLREPEEPFDVVFSDVVMPGMNGVELGREIRRLHPGLPVVLASGYSHVLAEEGRHGFDLLHKPYSVEQLSRVLRHVTKRRRRLPEAPAD